MVALPSSTLTRRLVPSAPITRSRSATGLKSTVAPTPGLSVSDILLFIVAWPDLGSMVDGVVAGNAVKHAVGRPHVDAEKGARAFDVGFRRHFAGRRVDENDRLAVDEPDDPTCRLGAARAEARCGKRCREHKYFEPSKHDVAPLKEIRVCRSGKVPAPTPGATRESQRGCRAAADFSFAAVTER